MDDDTAGERFLRSLVSEDEMIVAHSQQRLGERDLTVSRFLWSDHIFSTEKNDFSKAFRSSQMDPDPLMIFDSLCRRRSDFQKRVKPIGRESKFFVRDDMPPFD